MIKKVTFVNTQSCNMRCKYCFEQLGNYPNTFIKPEYIDKMLNLLFEQDYTGEYIIEFFGGEPFVYPESIIYGLNKIKEILLKGTKNTIYFHITSNFLSIDERVFELLSELSLYDNFDSQVTISILLDEEMHNKDRVDISGKGTYLKVYNNMIRAIEKYPNIYYSTNMVISKSVISNFSKIVDNVLEFHEKYPNVKNNLVLTSTLSVDRLDEYTKDELRFIFEDYIKRDKSNICDKVIQGIYGSIPYSFGFLENRELSFCRIFLEEVTILPNGNIIPCHRSDLGVLKVNEEEVVYGNIEEINSLKELNMIPNISDINNLISENRHFETEDGNKCNDCLFNSFCHYCPISNYNKTGYLTKRSRKECERAMTLVELTLEYERLKVMKEITNRLEKLENKMDILGELNITLLEKLVGDKNNEDTPKSIE